jgi:alpha-L-rhamnosidase
MADKGEVGTAYLHRSTATLAGIASILGALTSSFSWRCRTSSIVRSASKATLA